MKSKRWVCGLLLLSMAGAAQAGGNVVASLGMRTLSHDSWESEDIDQQPTIGVLADIQIADLPLHVALGVQVSANSDETSTTEITGSVADFSLGLKLMPASGVFRPYVGIGVASVGAAIEIDDDFLGDDDDSDQAYGWYAGGGALFRITKHLNVGLDLRWVRSGDLEARLDDFGTTVESDGDSFVATALIGYGWGD